jgi:hypothetical protein
MFRRTLVVTMALGLGTLAGCNEAKNAAKELYEKQRAKEISEQTQNIDKKLDDARHGEATKGTPEKDKAEKMREKAKDDE